MKTKGIISVFITFSLMLSILPNIAFAGGENYVCDFTKLLKDNAKTVYGTEEDVIKLDDYTTAYLTYEGTYVDADGKVYIKSGTVCNGNGKYSKGSYVSFTAPSDGTLTVSGEAIGWFEGNTYKTYGGNLSIDAVKGTTYNFGYRKDTTYISSLSFVGEQIDYRL